MKNQIFNKIKTCGAAAVIVMLLLLSSEAQARQPAKQTFATAPDGVSIAIQEYGNPNGAEIVLIHGLMGSHLDWTEQANNPLLSKFRLITYDLRGHGLSGKPTEPIYYSDGKRWGNDLHTVITAKGLKRPTLVGWSLGSVVMTNYVNTYTDSNIAGLVFVDAVIDFKPELLPLTQKTELLKMIVSEDLKIYLEGTREFLRQCFFKQPDDDAFNLLYANAAMALPEMVRTSQKGISNPAQVALPKVSVPVVLIQGDKDALVKPEMVELGRKLMPRAKVSIYAGAGHAPFLEQPDRFNKELSGIVLGTSQKIALTVTALETSPMPVK